MITPHFKRLRSNNNRNFTTGFFHKRRYVLNVFYTHIFVILIEVATNKNLRIYTQYKYKYYLAYMHIPVSRLL